MASSMWYDDSLECNDWGYYSKSSRGESLKSRFNFALLVRIVLYLLAAAGLIWAGLLAWHSNRLYQLVGQVRGLSQAGLTHKTAVLGLDLMDQAVLHGRALERAARPFLPAADVLGRMSFFRQLSQARPLVEMSSALLDGVEAVKHGLKPVLESLQVEDGDRLEIALSRLRAADADLMLAETSFRRAAEEAQKLDPGLLPEKLDRWMPLLEDWLDKACGGIMLLRAAPAIGAMDGQRVYLLIAQNNDELRPTGGFISAMGPLRMHTGRVIDFSMADSFSIDDLSKPYPPAPDALAWTMLAGYWSPRDANWSPDFPTSARDLSGLYTISTGIEPDGVVAFDPVCVAEMTRILGPLEVEAAPEKIPGDRVVEWMRLAWSPEVGEGMSAAWWAQRKEFIPRLGRALIQAFYSSDTERMVAAGKAAYGCLQKGHLLMWFTHPAEQAALASLDLDWGIKPGSGDYLRLVDANIGFNKTDALVHREVFYRVDLSDPGNPTAELQVSYTNQANTGLPCVHEARYGKNYADLMQRCYWDYWRVLAAPGSTLYWLETPGIEPGPALLNGRGWPGAIEENEGPGGSVEFAGLLLIPPGEQEEYRLGWKLPTHVLEMTSHGYVYRLTTANQPGLAGLPFRLEMIPPDGCVMSEDQEMQITLVGEHDFVFEFACR